jgi:hypothetical protein
MKADGSVEAAALKKDSDSVSTTGGKKDDKSSGK